MDFVHNGAEHMIQWDRLNLHSINFRATRKGRNIGRDGIEAFRIAGEVGAFDHAVFGQRMADELRPPGKFFSVMNAEIDPLVQADQQNDAIPFRERGNRRVGIVFGLRVDDIVRADASKRKNGMR